VAGLALSGAAVNPKARHVELGVELARRALAEYKFTPPLTGGQKELIYQAILYHDRPQQLAAMADPPPSSRLVCDVDHLWSFTHENFWQDTLRKGVDPRSYLENLENDLDGYFIGGAGKSKARQMLRQRRGQVLERWVTSTINGKLREGFPSESNGSLAGSWPRRTRRRMSGSRHPARRDAVGRISHRSGLLGRGPWK
jgi:hypothetical protein